MDDSTTLRSESPTTSSALRRRNSIATSVVLPKKLALPATPPHRSSFYATPPNGITAPTNTHTPPSLLDLELVSIKSPFFSYTSLKDVLPSTAAAVNSPTASSFILNSGYEISIRNRLVKQAAWAYLQPMSASPSCSSGPDFFHRLCQRWSSGHSNPLSACLSFVYRHLVPGITRFFNWILRAIRGQVCT